MLLKHFTKLILALSVSSSISYADELAGKIFYDVNGDSFHAINEPGIHGVTISAKNDTTNFVFSTQSDAAGFFSFDIPSGNYTVSVEGLSSKGLSLTTGNSPTVLNVSSQQPKFIEIGYFGDSITCPKIGLQNKQYSYFPTGDEKDAKFVSLAGTGLGTIGGQAISFQIVIPSTESSFDIGIFDGDTGASLNGEPHWDYGNDPVEFTLIADPLGDGSGVQVIQTLDGSSMADNSWMDFSFPSLAAAKSPSGHYFYRLNIRLNNPSGSSESNFKLRTTGALLIDKSIFSFVGGARAQADAPIIYPNFPSLIPTTYTGNWNFGFFVPGSPSAIEIWDGDFDFGSTFSSLLDIDDTSTPNAVPAFAFGTGAVAEGVSIGAGLGKGSPEDDSNFPVYRRSPNVVYTLIDPQGTHYLNSNPSGNKEWESFRIDTAAFNPFIMDAKASSLSSGVYGIDIRGLDLANLNALRIDNLVLGSCTVGYTPPIFPYIVGDFVWMDENGDGIFNVDEKPISLVVLNLKDSQGKVIGKTTTNQFGLYFFNVTPHTYTVEVATENFTGGVLSGLKSTTGGETLTRTITNQNDLTYDFGYRRVPIQIITPPKDCKGVVGGSAVIDRCGVCAGDGRSCVSCIVQSTRNTQLSIDSTFIQQRDALIRTVKRAQRFISDDRKLGSFIGKAESIFKGSWISVWSYPKILDCTVQNFCKITSLINEAEVLKASSNDFEQVAEKLSRYLNSFAKRKTNSKIKQLARSIRNRMRKLNSRNLSQIAALPISSANCD